MPNKRSDNKRMVAFWFTHKEAKQLAEAAASLGVNMTDFVKKAVSELIEKEQDNARQNAKRGNGGNN